MNLQALLTPFNLSKPQLLELIKKMNYAYPYYFKKIQKSEKAEYIKLFYDYYGKYDYELISNAIDKLILKNKFMPTFAEINYEIEDCLTGRIFKIVNIMKDNGYFRQGVYGTREEVDKKEFEAYDAVLESLEKKNVHKYMQQEIIAYIKNNIEMEEFRHLYLFEGILC
ncbi:MAG: replicative helicase loader/inhibitor [bacterium]|nr:replicative helicase loader/inhibitor [bacterium]